MSEEADRMILPWTSMPCPRCGCDFLATRGSSRPLSECVCVVCETYEKAEAAESAHAARLRAEIKTLQDRLRATGRILIDEIGSEGPANADATARRAVAHIRELRVQIEAWRPVVAAASTLFEAVRVAEKAMAEQLRGGAT